MSKEYSDSTLTLPHRRVAGEGISPHRGRLFNLMTVLMPLQDLRRSGGAKHPSRETLFPTFYLPGLAFSPPDGAKRGQVKG